MDRSSWRDHALCKGKTDLFFPVIEYGDWSKGEPDRVNRGMTNANREKAKELCRACPARVPCAAWAIAQQDQGVAATLTPRDRRQLRKRLHLPEPPQID